MSALPAMTWIDGVGILGVLLILAAYFAHQRGFWSRDDLGYSLANALGSAGVLFSLVFTWNLAAALLEGAWLLISLYGIARVRLGGRGAPPRAGV